MRAITIYEQLKDLNPDLFTGAVGTIRTFGSLPKSFYSPTYNTGKRTDGYQTLSNTIHEADGFYNVVTPIFDEETEKLGAIFFNVDHFTYPVISKTQEEQDAYVQAQEDSDQYGSKQSLRQSDGQIMVQRFFAYLHREVGLGNLTNARAVKVSNYMLMGLQFLSFGEMELAKNSFNSIDLSGETVANQTAIQAIIDLAITKIDNYIANEP